MSRAGRGWSGRARRVVGFAAALAALGVAVGLAARQGRRAETPPVRTEQPRGEARAVPRGAEESKRKAEPMPQLIELQTQLIFPGSTTQGQPDAVVKPPPGAELVRL